MDFDGDASVAAWEEIAEKLWAEDPGLSKVLEEALARGKRLPSGAVDVSGYLRSIERPWPPEGAALLAAGDCGGSLAWICCFVRGDANRDGAVNHSDPIYILNYLSLEARLLNRSIQRTRTTTDGWT